MLHWVPGGREKLLPRKHFLLLRVYGVKKLERGHLFGGPYNKYDDSSMMGVYEKLEFWKLLSGL